MLPAVHAGPRHLPPQLPGFLKGHRPRAFLLQNLGNLVPQDTLLAQVEEVTQTDHSKTPTIPGHQHALHVKTHYGYGKKKMVFGLQVEQQEFYAGSPFLPPQPFLFFLSL